MLAAWQEQFLLHFQESTHPMAKQTKSNAMLAAEFVKSIRKKNIEGVAQLFDEHGAEKILAEFSSYANGSTSDPSLARLVDYSMCLPENIGLLLDEVASRSIEIDLRPLGNYAASLGRPNVEALLVLASRGLVFEPSPSAYFGGAPWSPIVKALKYSGKGHLGVLAKLCDLGALRDGPGQIGFVDFVSEGLHQAAQLLLSKGFKPRSQVIASITTPVGMPAMCQHLYELQNDRWQKAGSSEILESLDKLATAGGDFAPQIEPSKCLIGKALADPLATASRLRAHAPASMHHIFANLPAELAKRGANPNLTGHYLASELALMESGRQGELGAEEALALGALPSTNPVAALGALAHVRNIATVKRWVRRLSQMGAEPWLLPALGAGPLHPLPLSLGQRNIGYFNLLLRQGASPEWEDVFTGNTLLHILAEKTGPVAEELLARLLAMPAMAHLVDKPRALRSAGGDSCGATPLLVACSAVNISQAKALLAAGANPNARDAMGRTALHCAGRKHGAKGQEKCLDVIRLLMAAGADSSLVDNKGLTPAQAMAARGPIDALAELLTSRPEDFFSNSEKSTRARQALEARGERSLSVVEKAVLGLSIEASASLPMTKKRRAL